MALSEAGYRVDAVATRRRASARKAAALVDRVMLVLTANQLEDLPPSKILLIATPDDEIPRTVKSLAKSQNSPVRGRFVLHTSGALSSAVLEPLARMGFHTGSLHPLVSISDPRTGYQNLRGAYYCVEGDAAATRLARGIVRDLKGQSFFISSRNKPLYHAAAVMASGHVVALFDLAIEMLVQCGLARKQARRVLLPLLQSTVRNLLTSEPTHALTGTFARGDIATVQRHLQVLSADGLSEALQAYKLLGARSLELASKNAIDPKLLSRIKQALVPGATKK